MKIIPFEKKHLVIAEVNIASCEWAQALLRDDIVRSYTFYDKGKVYGFIGLISVSETSLDTFLHFMPWFKEKKYSCLKALLCFEKKYVMANNIKNIATGREKSAPVRFLDWLGFSRKGVYTNTGQEERYVKEYSYG